ncbi:hypothetical protein AKN87_11475 [Thiopseudomonas alkaliphila]|nr:hypothetical protein AKN87_11475 [Thiopseudomonas alkaliphila]AKX48914.1 hypothetical protein AKN93_05460 [Thiopseudomonas alkaliphila]
MHGREPKHSKPQIQPQPVVPDLVRHLRSQCTAVNQSTSKPCHEAIHTLRPEMLKQVQQDGDVWA